MEMIIKKCNSCGALIKVIDECKCNCGFNCCGEEMKTIIPNSVDAAFEKHIPTYEIDGDEINIKVNHVMDDDHYIEWISVVHKENEEITYLKKGKPAICKAKYINGSTIYSYCNKHGLWKVDVK